MSRQNRVNPGMYTQRGRLTQDDAARELRKQRSIGSEHTWQPVKKNAMPELGDDSETSEDNQDVDTTPVEAESRPAARATTRKTVKKAAPVKAKAKSAKPKTTKSTVTARRTAKTKTGKAKTAKAAKTARKWTGTSVKRKAVLARNVGGGGAKPRPTTKRRKS